MDTYSFTPFTVVYEDNETAASFLKQPCSGDGNVTIHNWNWLICVSLILSPAAVLVDRYVTPFWYIIGFVGNIVTIKIWMYRRMKRVNTSALYLTVLAFTDLLFLVLHVSMDLKFAWLIPTLDVPVWCPTFFVLFMFAQYMSPLLVFGFTVERFVSIIRPFKSERFSRHHRAPKEIAVITSFAIAVSIPQAHGWVYANGECQGAVSDFFGVWTWVTDYLMFGVFPVTTFILNICVMRAAHKATKLRRESICQHENDTLRVTKRTSKIIPTTVTLLCISFYRIFTTLPVAVLFALQYTIPYGDLNVPVSQMANDPAWQKYFTWHTTKTIINEIGLSQYSCNFFIYLATAKHFRYEFKNLIRNMRTCSKKEFTDPNIIRQSTYTSNGLHSTRLSAGTEL